MQRLTLAAGLLLVVQLALVAVFNLGKTNSESGSPSSVFVDFNKEQLTEIHITDGQGRKLELEKKEGMWQLTSSYFAPASQTRVTELIDKLGALNRGFVVATSDSAARRFKVTDSGFERHLQLFQEGDMVADFYLGTSPGFRQMHARKAASHEIIAVSLSAFELEASEASWLNKDILKSKEQDLKQISFHDCTLVKNEEGWKIDGLPGSGQADEEAIGEAIDKVVGLTVVSVADPEEMADQFSEASIAFTVSLLKADESEVRLNFAQLAEDRFAVKSSEHDNFYLIHKVVFENLQKISRSTLLLEERSESAGPSEGVPE